MFEFRVDYLTFLRSYNIYVVQQDTQCGLMSKFYSALMLARHVSDLIGPSSGAFCTSCIRRLWYVVIRVLLDRSSRYEVVGRRWATYILQDDTRFHNVNFLKSFLISLNRSNCWITILHSFIETHN